MLLLLPLAACDMDGWKAGKQAQDRQTAKNKAMECIIDRLETTLVAGAEKGDYDDLCLVHWLITNDDIATRWIDGWMDQVAATTRHFYLKI